MSRLWSVIARPAVGAALVLAGATTMLAIPALAGAQSFAARESVTESSRATVGRAAIGRIAAGERASYELRLAGRSVGEGSLEVLGTEQIAGHNTLRTRLQVSGGVLFARVEDSFESWIDPEGL